MNNIGNKKHLEIERKFLVTNDSFIQEAYSCLHIKQGYLSLEPNKTVRVRISGDRGFLTIKGKRSSNGLSRYEWEQEIDIDDANEMMALCGEEVIDKRRYLVDYHEHIFEVDVFEGDNKGLVVAEIELSEEEEHFDRPQWLGVEVSHDKRYHNSRLIQYPYSTW